MRKGLKLLNFFSEFVLELDKQLEKDELRWKNAWLHYTREGQEDRIFNRFDEYHRDYREKQIAIPWLKIAGYCMIAWLRENKTELFPK
jgi:hypothetical protein